MGGEETRKGEGRGGGKVREGRSREKCEARGPQGSQTAPYYLHEEVL